MRLKGGKVLLDFGELSPKDIFLTNEEVKAICEKGLAIQITYQGLKLVIDCIIETFIVGNSITYFNFIENDSGDVYHVKLDFSDNSLSLISE